MSTTVKLYLLYKMLSIHIVKYRHLGLLVRPAPNLKNQYLTTVGLDKQNTQRILCLVSVEVSSYFLLFLIIYPYQH